MWLSLLAVGFEACACFRKILWWWTHDLRPTCQWRQAKYSKRVRFSHNFVVLHLVVSRLVTCVTETDPERHNVCADIARQKYFLKWRAILIFVTDSISVSRKYSFPLMIYNIMGSDSRDYLISCCGAIENWSVFLYVYIKVKTDFMYICVQGFQVQIVHFMLQMYYFNAAGSNCVMPHPVLCATIIFGYLRCLKAPGINLSNLYTFYGFEEASSISPNTYKDTCQPFSTVNHGPWASNPSKRDTTSFLHKKANNSWLSVCRKAEYDEYLGLQSLQATHHHYRAARGEFQYHWLSVINIMFHDAWMQQRVAVDDLAAAIRGRNAKGQLLNSRVETNLHLPVRALARGHSGTPGANGVNPMLFYMFPLLRYSTKSKLWQLLILPNVTRL